MGKFLDQPILVSKFQKTVPAILAAGGTAYTAIQTGKAEKGKKAKTALKTGITMGATIVSAIAAPHIASKIAKRQLPPNLEKVTTNNRQIVDTFIKNNKLD